MTDFVIIGAGIVGACIARQLSRYEAKILVLDKASDAASYQTLANSAIVHSGHDPKPGTLKARLCVRGNAMYPKMSSELDVPLLETGAFVVAHGEAEEAVLQELLDRAKVNGVIDAHLINRHTAHAEESHLASTITAALSLPSTKVTYPWEMATACLENAVLNSVEFHTDACVVSIKSERTRFRVELADGQTIDTRFVINAAGVHADRIAAMVEDVASFRILPRRGEYLVLDRDQKGFVNHVIYPLPNAAGKGVLIVPQIHGNLLLGPTSVPQTDREAVPTTREGYDQIRTNVERLADHIPFDKTIRVFAGVRASSTNDDFIIRESVVAPGFYHVAGIDSPGITAAPAIAEYLVESLILPLHPLLCKSAFDPYRIKRLVFRDLSVTEKQELITADHRYGNVVCKCEQVTEAEIVAAIHGPLGTKTVKGIKKRVRAGSGFCQGGYCEEAILKIIARETGKKLDEIDYYAKNTKILLRETKVKP